MAPVDLSVGVSKVLRASRAEERFAGAVLVITQFSTAL
jgi:hypothetical protein